MPKICMNTKMSENGLFFRKKSRNLENEPFLFKLNWVWLYVPGFYELMWPFGTEFAQIFQKLRILGGTILRLVTMSFLAHFCKKLTFYFASCDFNFGNFVMKLTGEEVNIVTYLPVLKNRKSVKNQVIYGQKTKKKSKFFGKLKKIQIFFWISNFFFNP